jgi:hypothetical protein
MFGNRHALPKKPLERSFALTLALIGLCSLLGAIQLIKRNQEREIEQLQWAAIVAERYDHTQIKQAFRALDRLRERDAPLASLSSVIAKLRRYGIPFSRPQRAKLKRLYLERAHSLLIQPIVARFEKPWFAHLACYRQYSASPPGQRAYDSCQQLAREQLREYLQLLDAPRQQELGILVEAWLQIHSDRISRTAVETQFYHYLRLQSRRPLIQRNEQLIARLLPIAQRDTRSLPLPE